MSELGKINQDMRLLAIKTVFRNHPVLLEKISTPQGDFNLSSTPEALNLDEPADILIRIAWDIWNGSGESELDKILNQLSSDDFEAFIDAMKDYHALRQKIHFSYVSGAEND